jgi:Domain of unknown function (DUF5004)
MKATKLMLSAILMLSLFIASCKPEYVAPDIVFGDPAVGIDGAWKLKSITQTDLLYKAPEKDKPVLDIKDFWTKGGNVYTCTFNKATRTYTTTGDVRLNYLGAAGTFSFDSEQYPSKVILTPTNGQPISLKLAKPIRAEYNNNLEVSQIRVVNGKVAHSYNYTFIK